MMTQRGIGYLGSNSFQVNTAKVSYFSAEEIRVWNLIYSSNLARNTGPVFLNQAMRMHLYIIRFPCQRIENYDQHLRKTK